MIWRNVSGSRSRQLLRNVEHTGSVHWFLVALAAQARPADWEIVQLDSPRRASRYFRHEGRLHSVLPDAFGVLRRAGETLLFFLEWERRAVRPVTMAARLAPYLRYYSSHRPLDDHGAAPIVWWSSTTRPGRHPLPAAGKGGDGAGRRGHPPVGIP